MSVARLVSFAALVAASFSFAVPVIGQSDQATVGIGDATYQDGKKTAEAVVSANKDITKDTDNQFAKENIGYQEGNPVPISREDAGTPGVLDNLGRQQEAFKTHAEALSTQPKFDPYEMQELVKNSYTVSESPNTYLGGISVDGKPVTCQPIPPSQGAPTTYEMTCNVGAKVVQGEESCKPKIDVKIDTITISIFDYYIANAGAYGTPLPRETDAAGFVNAGTCWYTGGWSPAATINPLLGLSNNKYTKDQRYRPLSCKSNVFAGTTTPLPVSAQAYWRISTTTEKTATASKNEGVCSALAGEAGCTMQAEVCTDSEPQTRVIDGVSVTQSCWEWNRTYSCNKVVPGNSDCGEIEANNLCRYDRTECLDDDEGASGSCQVENRVYVCSIAGGVSSEPVYACSDSIYCMNGQCDKIEAQPSKDFAKAVAALNSVAEAGNQFDPDNLRLFTGEGEGCSKPIFGLSNCCNGGKGIPLIGTCSAEERALARAVDKGVTHYVGSYCSSKFIVCNSKTQVYCVFQSKLGRILQEQGRAQLGLTWGKPKEPKCEGLTPEQFAALDLSKFDFSEVINDLMDKITIPDEAGQLSDMQAKIKAYFSSKGGQ